MRTRWLGWALSASVAALMAGCPAQPQQISEDFSPPPDTGPLDTNARANQDLSGISSRLSSGNLIQQTTTTTSGDDDVSNIEQTPHFSNDFYVASGAAWDPSGDTAATDGSGTPPPPPPPSNPPTGGGGDGPTARGATVYAGVVSGTDYEGVVGCCDATFSASKGASVSFDAGENLAELFMPGFVLLPNAAIRAVAGETNEYSGVVPGGLPTEWSYRVTTRNVSQSGDFFTATFDVVVFAHCGALTERGSAVHSVEGTRSGGRVQWSSDTNYQIEMHAVATGQPEVLLDTFQNWHLNGSLTQQ